MYHRDAEQVCFSIFGKGSVEHPYFQKQDIRKEIPSDAELGLGASLHQIGETQYGGRITQQGCKELRYASVEATRC